MNGTGTERRKPRKPGRLLRWFYRAPVLLFDIGLGGLMLGQLRLTTAGRRSGRPRRAVVDVLGHDATTDTYYVVSAYGGRSDWYRNLQADPKVLVQVRRREFSALTETLPREEAEPLFLDFCHRHRLYVRTMFRLIGINVDTDEDARAAAAEMKVVAIRPTSDG